jgi:hypothetical protein
MTREPIIIVKDLAMGYGNFVVMRDLSFIVNRGDIFIINSILLDVDLKAMTASGDPKRLLAESRDPTVRRFLTRGEEGRKEEK